LLQSARTYQVSGNSFYLYGGSNNLLLSFVLGAQPR